MNALYRFVRELVDIPSVTGEEAAVAERVRQVLERDGYRVESVETGSGGRSRPNVLARAGAGDPTVWFCTHLDTVPPFFPSNETDTHIGGRGSCDAKGILAAMLFAGRRLRDDGAEGFGFAFTVGEEVDSDGARRLEERGPDGPKGLDRTLICGEPTVGVLASGHKGTLRVVLRARGKAAHSAYPDQGDSAVHRLLARIARVREEDWGSDPRLGEATVNIGVISGGVAGNVLAPSAEATIYFRLVGEAAPARRRFAAIVEEDPACSWEEIGANDAVFCREMPGRETAPVAYSTDIPFLPSWGAPLLIGPGSIHDAHTAHERVEKKQLVDAVDYYHRIAADLLA